MRKTERLDQVLIRLGYATPSEIEQAVARQQTKGGRFGSNLVELGAVTEEQLFDALVEQFRVPTISVSELSVPRELLGRMPKRALSRSLVVPVAWNEAQRVLSLAVANPSDEDAIQIAGEAFGAKKVRVSIAPESVLRELLRRLGLPEASDDQVRLVALPELFEPETAAPTGPAPIEVGRDDRRVLMVTAGAARKNFLPPVLKPEGIGLIVVSNPEEAREAVESGPFEIVLAAPGMRAELAGWVKKGLLKDPGGEVVEFSSVSEALLENPLPYGSMVQSLRGAVQALAEVRCARHGVSAPYGLMSNDLEVLAERLGLRRVIVDGLHVGLHLLLPADKKIDPFTAFPASLELAARVRFAWPIEQMLSICQGLFVGRYDVDELEDRTGEVAVAAQLLALVWFRHNLMESAGHTEEEATTALRTSLRELAARIASLGLIETYLDAISERGGVDVEVGDRQVLLVGGDRISRALSPALTRVGCGALLAADVAAAQSAVDEADPPAIVIDHALFGPEVERFARVVKLGGNALLFVLTDATDPALVLNLLDIGVDDVFGPPHDFDLVAARVNRAIRSRRRHTVPGAAAPGQFSATFEAFSFLDLVQMLGNGMKTVRVDLTRGDGRTAVLHLVNGRPVYAACGSLTGPAAVYEVITWDEDGEFTVSEDSSFPERNLEESTESLLMEGVRLLDESRA